MSLVNEYRQYRRISKEIHNKIIQTSLKREYCDKTAKFFGIWDKGRIIIDQPTDADYVMDFTLYEKIYGNKSFIAEHVENWSGHCLYTEALIEAVTNAQTSLFEIEEINQKNNMLFLKDLLGHLNDVRIIDINLSKSLPVGGIIFCRLLRLDNFDMTSGVIYSFKPGQKEFLLTEYDCMLKEKNLRHVDRERFLLFRKLNQIHGIRIKYKEVE